MTKNAIIALVSALASVASAQSDRAVFDFTGPDPARSLPWTKTSVLEPGITTGGWRFGAGISLVSARTNRLAFSVTGGADLTTLDQARAASAYLSVTFTPAAGSLDLDNNRISFSVRRESWHAPLRYAVFSSADSFASPLFTTPLLDNADDATDAFSFLVPGTGPLSGTTEFRIYPFAARYSGHAASLVAFSLRAAAPTHTLSLSAGEGGTASAFPDRTTFEHGETVRVTAAAATGYTFAGWTGDLAGMPNPADLTMNSNISGAATFLPKAAPRMDLGGNLEALSDWTTAWVFKDCFKLARAWMTRSTTGSEWESGKTPKTGPNGWPAEVPFTASDGSSQILHTLLPLYGPGVYTVRFRGTGSIDLVPPNGGARQTLTGTDVTRSLAFSPSLGNNMLLLEVRQSSGANPVRNIEVIAPGQDSNLAAQPFHPEFLASLAPYRCLRFMDWLQTNFSPLATWAARTTPDSYTQTLPGGAALELAIALANIAHKDAWICIPHAADDDFVRQAARLLRDSLDPELAAYVEYSNETWNGQFSQTTHVQDRGEALALDADRWQAGQKFVARRSGEIFAIFAQEFGAAAKHRWVGVLASQAAGADGVTSTRIDAITSAAINPSGALPDALAIAPYFGVNYEPGQAVPSSGDVVTTLSKAAIAEAAAWAQAHRDLAEAHGWRLVCYEGGQHFVGILGAESNTSLTAQLQAANRDPRMEDRYREYLAALQSAGVDLFVNFTHVSEWSQWGSWGALEYQQQPPADAPKWRALEGWSRGLAARLDHIALHKDGARWLARLPLRPGRCYRIESSPDMVQWTPAAGLDSLRGSGPVEVAVPESAAEKSFWRVRQTD